jgi:hypothetical protein
MRRPETIRHGSCSSTPRGRLQLPRESRGAGLLGHRALGREERTASGLLDARAGVVLGFGDSTSCSYPTIGNLQLRAKVTAAREGVVLSKQGERGAGW